MQILFVADKAAMVHHVLGKLRLHIAKKYDLIDAKDIKLVWVVDFPMFEETIKPQQQTMVDCVFNCINSLSLGIRLYYLHYFYWYWNMGIK